MTQLLNYYPYGEMRLDERYGGMNQDNRFTGYEYDVETNLNYANARYQNGGIGRFLSQDPAFLNTSSNLSDPQSLNSYSYARNNPLILIDPDGRSWIGAFGSSLGGYGVGVAQGGYNFVSGIGNSVLHPVQAAQSTASTFGQAYDYSSGLVSNPSQTVSATGQGVGVQYNEFMSLSPYEQGNGVGTLVGETATAAYIGQMFKNTWNASRVNGLPSYANGEKLNHIFGNEGHNLGGVVKTYGSQEKAFIAIQNATENAVSKQGIDGIFKNLQVKVGSETITVRGNVTNNSVKIGTAFIKDK